MVQGKGTTHFHLFNFLLVLGFELRALCLLAGSLLLEPLLQLKIPFKNKILSDIFMSNYGILRILCEVILVVKPEVKLVLHLL
jgi:hypothetical protein